MGRQKGHRRGVYAAAAAAAVMVAAGAARAAPPSAFMEFGPRVAPPRGYLEFCGREPTECPEAPKAEATAEADPAKSAVSGYWRMLFASLQPAALPRTGLSPTDPGAAGDPPVDADETPDHGRHLVTITDAVWRELNEVNRSINRAITPRSDRSVYHVDDYWAEPLEHGGRYGDCEDYVLEKRRVLRERGYPEAALSIALVRTAWGSDHAVLLVDTDRGEVVLDSLSPWALSWRAVSYKWIARQSPVHPEIWIAGPGYRAVKPDGERWGIANARFTVPSAR